jgi:hypothetical protein
LSGRRSGELVVALLLVAVTMAVWEAMRWLPPLSVLRYGFRPAPRVTGRTVTLEGVNP